MRTSQRPVMSPLGASVVAAATFGGLANVAELVPVTKLAAGTEMAVRVPPGAMTGIAAPPLEATALSVTPLAKLPW